MSEIDSSITPTTKQARTKRIPVAKLRKVREQALLPDDQRETRWWEHDDVHPFIRLAFAPGEDVAAVCKALTDSGMYVSQVTIHCETKEEREARSAALEEAGFDPWDTDYGLIVGQPGGAPPDRCFHQVLENFIHLDLSDDPSDEELIAFAERFCVPDWPPYMIVDHLRRVIAAGRLLDPHVGRLSASGEVVDLLIQRGLVRPYPA